VHRYQDLITIFNSCFLKDYNTLLVKGGDEPIYLPASVNQPQNSIFFAYGFFASALHECSHWLIAGKERRTLTDFGYWYEPDGRSSETQSLFQSVEIKPQAMEWILSSACNAPFRTSIDNLNGTESDTNTFKLNVYAQVKVYCEKGLSPRAETFRQALCHFYKTPTCLKIENFDIKALLSSA
jgi:elongation factor P hydroxylase